MGYREKMAKKNRQEYILAKRIYLDDYGTYIASTGEGTFIIKGKNSLIEVDKSGSVNIVGGNIKLDSNNIDFSELPDRFVRPSGVSWDWIRNNTEVFGALPIRIKGKKVYIPFISKEIE